MKPLFVSGKYVEYDAIVKEHEEYFQCWNRNFVYHDFQFSSFNCKSAKPEYERRYDDNCAYVYHSHEELGPDVENISKSERVLIMYTYDKDDKKTGPFQLFHKNGMPMCVGNYIDGKRHGVVLSHDSDGRLLDVSYYDNGWRTRSLPNINKPLVNQASVVGEYISSADVLLKWVPKERNGTMYTKSREIKWEVKNREIIFETECDENHEFIYRSSLTGDEIYLLQHVTDTMKKYINMDYPHKFITETLTDGSLVTRFDMCGGKYMWMEISTGAVKYKKYEKINGEYVKKSFHANGILKSYCRPVDCDRPVSQFEYYDNGNIKEIVQYINGVAGKHLKFSRNGEMME